MRYDEHYRGHLYFFLKKKCPTEIRRVASSFSAGAAT